MASFSSLSNLASMHQSATQFHSEFSLPNVQYNGNLQPLSFSLNWPVKQALILLNDPKTKIVINKA